MTETNDEAKRGDVIAVGAVQFNRSLPGPVENVWSYLTDCKKLPQWFGEDSRIDAGVGGKVWLMDGHIRGVVTQWQPNRKLAYTWNLFDPGDEESQYPQSYLMLGLTAQDDTTLLNLLHIPVPEPFDKQTRMGWHTFLDLVEAGVAGEDVPTRESLMSKNAKLYGVDLNRLAK